MPGFSYDIQQKFLAQVGTIRQIIEPLLGTERKDKLALNLSKRSRSVICVFENTHHSHNISAILRTVDAFGLLETIFVYHDAQMRFRSRDSVERGASQWLLLRRAHDIEQTAKILKQAGYALALVSLPSFASNSQFPQQSVSSLGHFAAHTLFDGPFEKSLEGRPLALIFGSELKGISEKWIHFADFYLSVAMKGFVESLNVSVCAGILLHNLRNFYETQHRSQNLLSQSETVLVHEYWLARSTQHARKTIEAHDKMCLEYFDFIKGGHFFDPFPNSHCTALQPTCPTRQA